MAIDRGERVSDEIGFYGLLNVVLNIVAICLKTFLVWLTLRIWSDVRLMRDREERHQIWERRDDPLEREEDAA